MLKRFDYSRWHDAEGFRGCPRIPRSGNRNSKGRMSTRLSKLKTISYAKAELYDKMTDGVPKMAQESLLTTIEHYQTTVRELERKAEQELQEERK